MFYEHLKYVRPIENNFYFSFLKLLVLHIDKEKKILLKWVIVM